MSKATMKTNSKVKRKLLQELEASVSRDASVNKRRRSTSVQSPREPLRRNGGKGKQVNVLNCNANRVINDSIQDNNELVVDVVTKNNKRNIVSNKISENKKSSAKGSKAMEKFSSGLNSRVAMPTTGKFRTSTRAVKPPARFIEESIVEVLKRKPETIGKSSKKETKLKLRYDTSHDKLPPIRDKKMRSSRLVDIAELDSIDIQTNSEIADGNAAATDVTVDHDGVELSIHGSDLDAFSDEETGDLDNNRGQTDDLEAGEIETSDEEMTIADNSVIPPVQKPVSRSVKANKLDKFKHLRNDPDFNEFLDEVLDKKLADKGDKNHQQKEKDRGKKGNDTVNRDSVNRPNLIKSPSDTTLYSPGLRKALTNVVTRMEASKSIDEEIELSNSESRKTTNLSDKTLMEKISNFVDNLRLDAERGSSRRDDTDRERNMDLRKVIQQQRKAQDDEESTSRVDQATDQLLIQAEKFKARVEAPKGTYNEYTDTIGTSTGTGITGTSGVNSTNSLLMPYDYERLRTKFITPEGLAPIDNEILFLRNFDQDDEFFHVTSQIDPNLRTKIERGEYVDLERLLPKDKFSFGNRSNAHDEMNKQLFQLISQGTNSYLSPPEAKTGRVNNIRKWDQAFRVYAAIYTQANPSRSGEIWQYVYVIHTAATSNPWENVAYYDITFRELMASKPWRNWGKTYTQGWNMAFNNNSTHGTMGYNHNSSRPSYSQNNHQNHQNNQTNWKDDCCWRFNKNKCKRTSTDCRYDHRCAHCAGWYHSWTNCRKRLGSRQQGNNKSGNWDSFNKGQRSNTSTSQSQSAPASTTVSVEESKK